MRILRTRGFVFRTVVSANHFSIYGAVKNGCEDFVHQISDHSSIGTGNFVAKLHVNQNFQSRSLFQS